MEKSVYFLIGNNEKLVRDDNFNDTENNTNADKEASTDVDGNTNLISDTYTVENIVYEDKKPILTKESFSGVRSLFNTSATTDNFEVINNKKKYLKSYNYINYRGMKGSYDLLSQNGVSSVQQQVESTYTSIIKWTSEPNNAALILRPSDLVYHRDFGVQQNTPNRMLIVRRFESATPHDLIGMKQRPISTLVTWLKPEDEPFTIKFNEKWKVSDDGFINVINDVLGFSDLKPLPTFENLSTFTQSLAILIGNKLGIVQGRNNPLGDPDVIHQAAIRETNYKGLECDFTINFKAEYVFNYIQGVDPNLAMLDIIANCTRMGTSNSKFIVTGKFGYNVDSVVKRLESGDIDGTIEELITRIGGFINEKSSSFMGDLKNKLDETLRREEDKQNQAVEGSNGTPTDTNSNKDKGKDEVDKVDLQKKRQEEESKISKNIDELKKHVGNFIQTSLSKYKWRLRGASAAMTGAPTAHWHVTMGNPLCPWFSCGNLYIDSMQLDIPHMEMSFADTPMVVKVNATFKPGRVLGAQEIQQLFNSGKDRIYTLAPKQNVSYKPKEN